MNGFRQAFVYQSSLQLRRRFFCLGANSDCYAVRGRNCDIPRALDRLRLRGQRQHATSRFFLFSLLFGSF